MLVLERQAIEEIIGADRVIATLVFHLGDHLLATAGVTGNRIDADRITVRQQACGAQRAQKRDCAGRVAARIGDETGGTNLLALFLIHFGKAIGPVLMDAIGGRGIDDADIVIAGHHRDRFPGSIVRQAEDRNVGIVEHILAHRRIAALGLGYGQQLDIAATGKARADLQTRGAVFAIDEDLRCHVLVLTFQRVARVIGISLASAGFFISRPWPAVQRAGQAYTLQRWLRQWR
jgi:hypothetical protein